MSELCVGHGEGIFVRAAQVRAHEGKLRQRIAVPGVGDLDCAVIGGCGLAFQIGEGDAVWQEHGCGFVQREQQEVAAGQLQQIRRIGFTVGRVFFCRSADREGRKGVIHEAAGVFVLLRSFCSQCNDDQMNALRRGIGDEVSSGFLRPAGLAAFDTGIIVNIVCAEHAVGGADGAGLAVFICDGQCVCACGVDGAEVGIFQTFLHNESQIVSAGVMRVIVETGGIDEVGINCSKLGCAGIHEVCKGADAAGSVFSEGICDFIGRGQEQAVQAVPDGHFLADLHGNVAASGGKVIDGASGEGHHVAEIVIFDGEQRGHELCGARRVMLFRGVLCIKDRAAVCVHDDRRGAADLGRRRPVGGNLVDQCVDCLRIALCGLRDDGCMEKHTAGKQACAKQTGAQCARKFLHRMKFQSSVLSI